MRVLCCHELPDLVMQQPELTLCYPIP